MDLVVVLMENYLKNGHIRYKFKRILLNESLTGDSNYIFQHDEILAQLKLWNGSTNQCKKHLLLKSNYPWLFSSRNEIKNKEDLNAHRILPIITLSEIGRKSLTALKNIILHDKYAHLIELLTYIGVFRKWSKNLSKTPTPYKTQQCLVHGVNIMIKKKILYYAVSAEPPPPPPPPAAVVVASATLLPVHITCMDILSGLYENAETRLHTYYLEILAHHGLRHEAIEERLLSVKSIQFIRSICEIVLGNNRKIISHLQGKESAVRMAVPKRVLSCRAQICLAPHLTATQIGIPYWWAKYINFETDGRELRICNDDNAPVTALPTHYLYKLAGQRILGKRDPIIHILAFCVFDEVFFHRDSRFKVGAESLHKMAADFDGDTFILYFISDHKVMYEIDYSASPRYNMALHGQCRINLIESIVLTMYRRNVNEKIPHWRLYNFMRRRHIYKWISNIRNCSTLEAIVQMSNRRFSLRRLYNMVEPTDLILADMIMSVYVLYGSKESYSFYCQLLQLSMELSIEFEAATLYQPNLPCIYTLTDDLLNSDLLAVSFSCAKGSIHTYKSLLDKIYEKDQHTSLLSSKSSPPPPPVSKIMDKNINSNSSSSTYTTTAANDNNSNFDYNKLISDITNANIFAAKKSKQVPQQGYNLFKDTIEGDLMSFGDNKLNYDNRILIEDIYLRIPLSYILKSSLAYSIIYE